jgi:hypothetical protein
MNERTFTVINVAQLATAIMVALLLALAALLLSTKPAEAVPHINSGGGPAPGDLWSKVCDPGTNNNFSDAFSWPWFQDGWVCSNNISATVESYEPKPYSSATSNCSGRIKSEWYRITPTYTSTVTLSAYSKYSGIQVALYKVPDMYYKGLMSLELLNCSKASANGIMSPITKQLEAGKTYYVQISAPAVATSEEYQESGRTYTFTVDWASCYYSSSGQRLCPV